MDALDLVMRSEKKTFLSVKSSVLMRFVNLQRVFLCPSFWADFFFNNETLSSADIKLYLYKTYLSLFIKNLIRHFLYSPMIKNKERKERVGHK